MDLEFLQVFSLHDVTVAITVDLESSFSISWKERLGGVSAAMIQEVHLKKIQSRGRIIFYKISTRPVKSGKSTVPF
jgi:hypothetical protein